MWVGGCVGGWVRGMPYAKRDVGAATCLTTEIHFFAEWGGGERVSRGARKDVNVAVCYHTSIRSSNSTGTPLVPAGGCGCPGICNDTSIGRCLLVLWDRGVLGSIGAPQLELLRAPFPCGVVLGELRLDLTAQQATPRGQVHLEQVIAQLQIHAGSLCRQQGLGRVVGAPQGGAVSGINRQPPQGFTGGQRLLSAHIGQAREVISALDPVFEVEAAQAVANQQDPEGHGHFLNETASYLRALWPLTGPQNAAQ